MQEESLRDVFVVNLLHCSERLNTNCPYSNVETETDFKNKKKRSKNKHFETLKSDESEPTVETT